MVNCVQNPGQIRDLARDITIKELSPNELVQRYLNRIKGVTTGGTLA